MQLTTTTSTTTAPNGRIAGTIATVAAVIGAIGLVVLLFSHLGLLASNRAGAPAGGQTLTASLMRFDRPTLRVNAGAPVMLNLHNNDLFHHSFDVDELNVHQPLDGRERTTVTFTPTTPGEYTFYCGIPGHAAAGMTGTLIVEP